MLTRQATSSLFRIVVFVNYFPFPRAICNGKRRDTKILKSILEFYAWEWQQNKGHGTFCGSALTQLFGYIIHPEWPAYFTSITWDPWHLLKKILMISNEERCCVSVIDLRHGARIFSCSGLLSFSLPFGQKCLSKNLLIFFSGSLFNYEAIQ